MMRNTGLWSWLRNTDVATWLAGEGRRRRRQRCPQQCTESLEPRCVLATFTVNSSKVASATDYFATEQNNVLDYSEAQSPFSGVDDRENAGLDDDSLVNPNVSNGAYNFTTTAASQIFLLFPGIVDGDRVPFDRQVGVVPEEGSGELIPIDTSKYYILNIKITAPDNVPNFEQVGGAAFQGNVQWDNGRAVAPNSATRPFFIYPGTNIYTFNLKTITQAQNGAGAWTGNIAGLRLYPSNTAGVNLSIDWVTLTGENQASVPVSITGATGNVQVGVSTTGNAANLIKLNGNAVGSFETRQHLVTPRSSITNVDVTNLAPGNYFLHALDSNGNVLSGTTAQPFTINAAPSSNILTPSARGDLSRDFATETRNGDAWDFSQTSDYLVPFLTDPTEYGVPTLATDPTTTVAGQISNNGNSWMRYDSFTASVAANRNDPHFLLTQSASINTSIYKNLTVRQLLDRTRNIGEGAVTRVLWSDVNPLAGGFVNTIVQTDDIPNQNGVREFSLHMPDVKIEPAGKSQKKWSDSTSIKYLRIDPHEYPTQTVSFLDQVWLTPNERTTNGRFNITWQTSDPNGDAVNISKIFLDTDRTRLNGNEKVIASNVANSGTFQFDTAAISSLGAGTYFVMLEVNDGLNSSFRYSTGRLDVTPVGPAGTKIMQRIFNPNANFHFYTTAENQTDFALRAGYIDEATARPGFAIHTSQVANSLPLHRLYNLRDGFHYYTLNTAERDFLVSLTPPGPNPAVGWRYEGDEGFMFANQVAGTSEIFRLYNRDSGTHLFTQDVGTKDTILRLFPNSWRQEASVGFAFATGYATSSASAAVESVSASSSSDLDLLLAELGAAGVDPRITEGLAVALADVELPDGVDLSLIASLIADPDSAAELLETLNPPAPSDDVQEVIDVIDDAGLLDDVLEELNLGDSALGNALNQLLGR
jgi:hypothetical protein